VVTDVAFLYFGFTDDLVERVGFHIINTYRLPITNEKTLNRSNLLFMRFKKETR
jgi:hypothetical protein